MEEMEAMEAMALLGTKVRTSDSTEDNSGRDLRVRTVEPEAMEQAERREVRVALLRSL